MKYSLRSLMVVVTVVGIVLGGRIEYLRRWSAFHSAEEHRILLKLATSHRARYESTESLDETAEMLRRRLASLALEEKNVDILPGFFRPRLAAQGEIIPVEGEDVEWWMSAIRERQLRNAYLRTMIHPWNSVKEPPRLQVTRR